MEKNDNVKDYDSTSLFYGELAKIYKKYKPLTLKEEADIADIIQQHLIAVEDKSKKLLYTEKEILEYRNKLCLHNICFIYKNIKKLFYSDLTPEYGIVIGDIMNQAYEGAFEATLKYHGEYKFATYAFRYFMEWGSKSIKEEASAVRVPMDIIRLKNKVGKEANRFYAANGFEASDELMSSRLNLNLETVKSLNSKRENHPIRVSLSTELAEDFNVGDTIDSKEYADLKLERESMIKELTVLTNQLKEQEEKIVIEALFGFGSFENEIPLISYQSEASTKQIFSDVVTDMLLEHFIVLNPKYNYVVEDEETEEMFNFYKTHGDIDDIPESFNHKRFKKLVKILEANSSASIENITDIIQDDEYRSKQNILIYHYKNALEKLRKFHKMKDMKLTTIARYTELQNKFASIKNNIATAQPIIKAAELEKAISLRKRKNVEPERHYSF